MKILIALCVLSMLVAIGLGLYEQHRDQQFNQCIVEMFTPTLNTSTIQECIR